MEENGQLKRHLGFWSLTATAVGGVIGSGWLFGAMYAAQAAGPASILAWIVGGIAMLLVALVFSELSMVKPESGGLVRYPLYTNGTLTASIAGWAMWLGFAATPSTEAAGIVQYASRFWKGLFVDSHLSGIGIVIAVLLMLLFNVFNYFGVQLFAKSNTSVTVVKFIVPTLTLVTLLMSGFHSSNLTHAGGFAPYGWGAGLSCIATSGIIFAYTGFRNPIDLGGEAKNPRRNIPLALIVSILIAIVLYIGLEFAFLGAVPFHFLGKGWHGVNFNSPFADLAFALNLTWLYWILIADSMLSPAGTGLVYTATNARNVYGLAKNGFFPKFLEGIHKKYHVPTRAMLLNFLVGLVYLFPLKSWQGIIAITSVLAMFTFSAGPISLMVFRRMKVTRQEHRLWGMNVIAPIAFAIGTLMVFWEPWPQLRGSLYIMGAGVVIYLVTFFIKRHSRREFAAGIWMVVHLAFVFFMSSIGSFGGADLIHGPWDSVIVAVVSLIVYFWGVRSGVRYMTTSKTKFVVPTDASFAEYETDENKTKMKA